MLVSRDLAVKEHNLTLTGTYSRAVVTATFVNPFLQNSGWFYLLTSHNLVFFSWTEVYFLARGK